MTPVLKFFRKSFVVLSVCLLAASGLYLFFPSIQTFFLSTSDQQAIAPRLIPLQSPLDLYGQKNFSPPAESKHFVYVLFDVGEDPKLTQEALKVLPQEIAIALSPHTPDVRYWAQQFHQKGHEIILSIGLEPEGFPINDPGHHTLLTGLSAQEMTNRVTWALKRVPYAISVTHTTGSCFTAHPEAMQLFFQALNARQLSFIDTVMTPETLTPQLAISQNIPFLMVDHPLSHRTALPTQKTFFHENVTKDGRCVISSPLSESTLALIKSLPRAQSIRGKKNEKNPAIVFVPLSFALINPLP